MSTSVAMHCSCSNQTSNQGFQDLSMFNAGADLMGLGLRPVAGLLQYEPTPLIEELVEKVIENPCGLLATLTGDNTVRQRGPEQCRSIVIFQTFVPDTFEPNLLKEMGKYFPETQG